MRRRTKSSLCALLAVSSFVWLSANARGGPRSPDGFEISVATQQLFDAVGETGRAVVRSIYLVVCPPTSKKGTAFSLRGGPLVTNEHVVKDCSEKHLVVRSSEGKEIVLKRLLVDSKRYLALLFPSTPVPDGLRLALESPPLVGVSVSTWGHPLAYNGPAPLLTVGYLSGFRDHRVSPSDPPTARMIVNGAFNPGNSGGPLFVGQGDKVVGIVVSKHAPISPLLLSAIEALAENTNGVRFTAVDENGNKKRFAESQVVAQLLTYFRELTQVVIGEAIAVSELRTFLREHGAKIPD